MAHHRHHPVATFLALLILGPYLLAAAALVITLAAAVYLTAGIVYVASGRWPLR
jgi:hypothetical protein